MAKRIAKTPHKTDIWVGVRARMRRLELGLSQTEVGDRLGITFQQIQKYERGMNRIGASRLHELSAILAVPISYFFPDPSPASTALAAPTGEVSDLLSIAGAVQILRDFGRIRNPATRSAVRALLASLVDARAQAGEVASP